MTGSSNLSKSNGQRVGVTPQTDWLVGGGEMGELIRSMHWAETPLGPIKNWPHSLRTTVNLCLSSNFPSTSSGDQATTRSTTIAIASLWENGTLRAWVWPTTSAGPQRGRPLVCPLNVPGPEKHHSFKISECTSRATAIWKKRSLRFPLARFGMRME